jgi:hypothetical protein
VPERGQPLYLGGNDDEPEKLVRKKNAATGALEVATGLGGLLFFLAATETGGAIHASLSKAATERGATGKYFAVFEGSDLATHLAALAGQDVFEVFGNGQDVNYVTRRAVVAVRP